MEERNLSFFERYLTLWVFLCMGIGIIAGKIFPQIGAFILRFTVADVWIPIAIALFFMIYPIMLRIDFGAVVRAGKTPKPIAITLFVNWAIKPFFMALVAWFFLGVVFRPFIPAGDIKQYIAGIILLGVAPCTAMVLMWGHLARGNQGHNLVMVSINSLAMLVLYAPLAALLLGISGIAIPWDTLALTIAIYIASPLLAGYITRKEVIKRKGINWFENSLLPVMGNLSIIALLFTLILLFSLKGETILRMPLVIAMIAVPLLVEFFVIFAIGYGLSRFFHLSYEDAAPTALIGASNHFEISIATAIMLFGVGSGATLATVVGPLIEVPVMLLLVNICLRTTHWFRRAVG